MRTTRDGARTLPPARTALVVLALLAVAGLGGAPPASSATAAPALRGGWAWPLEGSPEVVEVFDRPEHRWSPGHRGVDLAAAHGSAVLAPTSGTVVFAGRVVDRDVVSIEALDGTRATLEPVTAAVSVGDAVLVGGAVGTVAVGASHCAPASCLHWGVRVGRDTYLDPLLVLLSGGPPGPPALLTPRSPGRESAVPEHRRGLARQGA